MILGNYSILNKNPNRLLVSTSHRGAYIKPSTIRSFHTSEADGGRLQYASVPTGTEPPYSFNLAPKGGELSSTTSIVGTGDIDSSLLLGRFATASLTGSGDLTASMSLITSLVAALSGSGTISADLKTTLSMAAALAGSGSLSASLSLLMEFTAALTGTGSVTANLKGNADLEAAIYVNQSEATVQQIVDAVWNAVAADYNTSGTMGQKLNGAGSAGDPWTTDLSSYNTADTAGLILKQAKAKAALAASLSA